MLSARYADDGSAELVGAAEFLKELARLLRTAESTSVALQVPSRPANPYRGWLDSIIVNVEPEPLLLIATSGSQLILRGGQKSLEVLADNVEDLADARDGENGHTHIEYYPGHYYLREGSLPLVVAVAH